jgi:cell wall assembly regulator SMI1
VVVALCLHAVTARGGTPDPIASGWRAQALANAHPPTSLQNNLVAGALARRDAATAQWRAAVAGHRRHPRTTPRPDPLAKPEYVVVWAGHANASDENGQSGQQDAGDLLSQPGSTGSDANGRFVPGLDGFVVLDARRRNVDGTPNPAYGKVANFVQLPIPWGVEAEPHHMQYQWDDGEPLLAGGLFNSTTFVVNVKQIPQLALQSTLPPQAAPHGSVPDAYDAAGKGRFIGTYMGGPTQNYAGSPGEVVVFKRDPKKGYVVASETAGGAVDGRDRGNGHGVPEPCGRDEAAPLNTCSNPHGIQVRPDLGRMVTSDYAEPKMVVLDPVKPSGGDFFRPTVRVWDTSNVDHPKLLSVAHMTHGWRPPNANTMHDNRGVMENAKTWPRTRRYKHALGSKGFFAGAMCGGGIFFTPDVTRLKRDSTHQWREVFDDGIALRAARHEPLDQFFEDEGPCEGGAWMQVSRNNRWLFRAVSGQAPNPENTSGRTQPVKVVYDVNVRPLIRSARDGHIACDLAHGIDTNHDGKIDVSGPLAVKRIASGRQVADCPRLTSTLTVNDTTSGGPHWGAIDNHSLTPAGSPTRLVFTDYFVARSGVDGNHRLYMANVDPRSGRLSYDRSWRDERTGQLGTNFNRNDWPGNPGAGFYKPHSMVWVCPPGICPADPAVNLRTRPQPPPPKGRPQTTWSGTCKMQGTVHIRDPYTLVPLPRRWYTTAVGSCKGTLNGRPYKGPARLHIDGRMGKPMACETGLGIHVPAYLYFHSSPRDANPTVIDMYHDETHEPTTQVVHFAGAYRGDIAGTFNVHGSPTLLLQCAGPGIGGGHFDTTLKTLSELYG